jgi:small subunit ribosomal protein S12e
MNSKKRRGGIDGFQRLIFFLVSSMSDHEEVIDSQEVEVAVEATTGQMSVEDALQEVLRRALVHDGLARGLKEAVKALDR